MIDEQRKCKRCHLDIVDGQAYKLGQDQWHVSCFSCSKCQKSLGVNSNFLVLGTGALVCSNCSYSCKSCSKKIYDLAILTGDQAYCADCFKCKSCKNPIDDLKYARTSKGLFCMPCHHMLMEKKKKYEMMKLKRSGHKKANDEGKTSVDEGNSKTSKDDGVNLLGSIKLNTEEKSSTTNESSNSSLDIVNITSESENNHLPPPISSTSSSSDTASKNQIELKLNQSLPNTPTLNSNFENETVPVRSPFRNNSIVTPIKKSTSQYRTPELATPSKRSVKPTNLLNSGYILEESIDNDLKVKNESVANKDEPEHEPESFINLDDETTEEENSIVDSTEFALMSPVKNLTNDEQHPHQMKENFKFGGDLVSNTPTSYSSKVHQRAVSNSSDHFRLQNHQRQISGAETITDEKKKNGLGRSLTKVFKTRKSNNDENNSLTSTPKAHTRNRSDHSNITNATPTIPMDKGIHNKQHQRSVSETSQFQDTELNSLRVEINSLTISKASILKEIQNLQLQKKQLEIEVNDKQKKLNDLDSLISKHPSNSYSNSYFNQSVESFNKPNAINGDYGSINSSSNEEELRNESFDKFPMQPPLSQGLSTSSTKKNGSTGGGFMRRFFGSGNSNSSSTNGTPMNNNGGSNNGIISQPMNPVHGDEALLAMNTNIKNSMSYHENLNVNNQQPVPSNNGSIKTSKSTNFLKLKNANNNNTTTNTTNSSIENNNNNNNTNSKNKNTKLYSMNIEEMSNYEQRNIPYIIEKCIEEVHSKGIKQEGIYRVSASTSNVEKLEQYFERYTIEELTSGKFDEIYDCDINAIAGLLKRYLKKIPDSLIPVSNYNYIISIGSSSNETNKFNNLRDIIINLPTSNRLVLYKLIDHLNEISVNEAFNKMNLKSLATVFAPTLIRNENLNPHLEIQDNQLKTQVMEYLFRNYKEIFEGI